jgi:hypothetical protein
VLAPRAGAAPPPPVGDEQVRLRLAAVLTELSSAVRVYGRLAVERVPGQRDLLDSDLNRHLTDAEARQDQLNELLSADPAAEPVGWPVRGELVSHLDRLRTEVKVGIKMSKQYGGSQRMRRSIRAVRETGQRAGQPFRPGPRRRHPHREHARRRR